MIELKAYHLPTLGYNVILSRKAQWLMSTVPTVETQKDTILFTKYRYESDVMVRLSYRGFQIQKAGCHKISRVLCLNSKCLISTPGN